MRVRDKNITLKVHGSFEKAAQDEEGVLTLEGFANTTQKDRSGDVIPMEAWEKEGALDNFLKNPVLLAHHNRERVIGNVVEHEVNPGGLKVTAKVYEEADPQVFKLIQRGLLKAFSIGFVLKEADYDVEHDIFFINAVELLEVSVVTIPDNQDSVFSVGKQMDADSYCKLKEACREKPKALDSDKDSGDFETMANDRDDLAKTISAAIDKAFESRDAEKHAAEEEARRKREKEEQIEAKARAAAEDAVKGVNNTVIEAVKSGAERLSEDLNKRLEDETVSLKTALEERREEIRELRDELMKMHRTDVFSGSGRDRKNSDGLNAEMKDTAVLLSKCLSRPGKSVTIKDLEYGQEILKAAGFDSGDATTPVPGDHTVNDIDWETEFSMRLWEDIRRELVIEPALQSINMRTNNMRIPVNPEQDYATYIAIDEFKASTSTPSASVGNRLTEKTLTAHKLAAKDYIGMEETEDSLIPIIPIIRQNIVRRMAKSSDRSLLRGVGATHADPVKGLQQFAIDNTLDTEQLSLAGGDKLTVDSIIKARRGMGVFGIRPGDLTIFVGDRGYYDLLEDPDFRRMDAVGNQATLLTGQVGMVAGSPVVVSAEFANTAGNAAAVIFNRRNYWVGNHRGLTLKTDEDIEKDMTIIVATRRFGSIEMEANGCAIVKLVA